MGDSVSKTIRGLDLFAGVGGSSLGATLAGVQIVAAVDVWPLAKRNYLDNFKDVKFYGWKSENLSASRVQREVGPVHILLASPECTNHSTARGNAERSEASQMTAFQVIKFARRLNPRWIVVENVTHMRAWQRYEEWINELKSLGYNIRQQILNAADFGVPQSRQRLFVVCDSEDIPPEVMPLRPEHSLTAESIVHTDGRYPFSPLKTERRAQATLERAERAIATLGNDQPFLLVYYGSDGAGLGGWQSLDRPLRTVTTLDRFAYVHPGKDGRHEMRMLQVPELKKAMGFPESYKLNHGNRRARIKLLGNAVCPPVMTAIVRAITYESNPDSDRHDQTQS